MLGSEEKHQANAGVDRVDNPCHQHRNDLGECSADSDRRRDGVQLIELFPALFEVFAQRFELCKSLGFRMKYAGHADRGRNRQQRGERERAKADPVARGADVVACAIECQRVSGERADGDHDEVARSYQRGRRKHNDNDEGH